jgi:quercetin dioxygenase-like cupin family protein
MEIFRRESLPVINMNGSDETRRYYEFSHRGFVIVETCIPPGHVQNEHRHDQLLDIMFVLEGEIRVSQREDGIVHEETLNEGDMICFAPPVFHNVANVSNEPARTLTLKMRADSTRSAQDLARLFKSDWTGYADR